MSECQKPTNCHDTASCPECQKDLEALEARVAEKTKAVVGQHSPPPQPQPERSRVKFYRPSKNHGKGERMFDVFSYATDGRVECKFPPCTNTFPATGAKRDYCGKPCRKKDGSFRKKRDEFERAQAQS